MSGKALLRAIEHLPDEASVPVGWVRETIAAGEPVEDGAVDLTVAEVAVMLEKSPSTVRAMMPALERHGAYKLGRQWRVPRTALRSYFDTLSSDQQPEAASCIRIDDRRSDDLGRWREEGT